QQALAIYRAEGDHLGEARCLNMLGFITVTSGDKAGAQAHFEQALSLYYLVGDRQGEATILNNLGNIALLLHDYEAAQSHHEQSLAIRREIDDRPAETKSLVNMGRVALALGSYARARDYSEQAVALARELGSRNLEGVGLVGLSASAHGLGNDQAAREYAAQAVAIAQEIGARQDEGYALGHLARALLGLDELSEASDVYERGRVLYDSLGQPTSALEFEAGLARVALRQGETTQALARVQTILTWLGEHGDDGLDDPLELYLTCYEVQAGEATRRDDVRSHLHRAHTILQAQAARIQSEPLRDQFLHAVDSHRAIMAAWEQVAPDISKEASNVSDEARPCASEG
nr:tetratricopeptide repeat protein [Ardenticatenales bacterium]